MNQQIKSHKPNGVEKFSCFQFSLFHTDSFHCIISTLLAREAKHIKPLYKKVYLKTFLHNFNSNQINIPRTSSSFLFMRSSVRVM